MVSLLRWEEWRYQRKSERKTVGLLSGTTGMPQRGETAFGSVQLLEHGSNSHKVWLLLTSVNISIWKMFSKSFSQRRSFPICSATKRSRSSWLNLWMSPPGSPYHKLVTAVPLPNPVPLLLPPWCPGLARNSHVIPHLQLCMCQLDG